MIALSDVSCHGSEFSILNCSHNRLPGTQCGPREDAGVVCQRMKNNSQDIFYQLFAGCIVYIFGL